MPTIKKICILVSICFISLAPANAQTESEKYGFFLSPLLGILYGQGEEILYKYSGRDQYASQLLWDLKPLVFTGRAFGDYLSWGHYLKGGGKFIFSPLLNMDLCLSCSYRYITGTRGPSYWKHTGADINNSISKNYDGGAGHSALELEFAVRIRVKTN